MPRPSMAVLSSEPTTVQETQETAVAPQRAGPAPELAVAAGLIAVLGVMFTATTLFTEVCTRTNWRIMLI